MKANHTCWFPRRRINEADQQVISLLRNILDSVLTRVLSEEIKRQSDSELLNSLFLERIDQTFHSSHYMRFDYKNFKISRF